MWWVVVIGRFGAVDFDMIDPIYVLFSYFFRFSRLSDRHFHCIELSQKGLADVLTATTPQHYDACVEF